MNLEGGWLLSGNFPEANLLEFKSLTIIIPQSIENNAALPAMLSTQKTIQDSSLRKLLEADVCSLLLRTEKTRLWKLAEGLSYSQ